MRQYNSKSNFLVNSKKWISYQLLFITILIACQLNAKAIAQQTDTTVFDLANVVPERCDEVGKAVLGTRIFEDRNYVFTQLPHFLSGAHYLIGSISDGNRIVPVTTGSLLIITPLAGQEGSQEEQLRALDFTRVEYPSFKLFEEQTVEIGIFKKDIAYERFRLQDVSYDGWAVPFFSADSLPSITTPAQVTWSPGEEYGKNTRLWQGVPSIGKTGKRLWAAWMSGGTREPDAGNYGIVSYKDPGTGWVDPAMVIVHPDGNVRVMDPQLWTDPDGSLWVFWVQNTGAHGFDGIWGTWAIHIDNPEAENPTWTSPRRLFDGLMRNKPIVLSTGEWLAPSYNWVSRQSAVYISYDKGKSWTLQGGPVNPPAPVNDFYEHMVVELNNGNLWMLQRSIQGSVSTDKGKTWTALDTVRTNAANSRLYIGRLRSGNLLLIYNNHPTERENMTAFLSKDGGKTWPYKLLLDERAHVSYPDVVQGEDGLIRVIYDRSRTGKKEILMAVFTESDIVNGKFMSPQSAQKKIISNIE